MKYNLLSIIPYFGGDSSAAHSSKQTRLIYFVKTYESLIGISDKIIVSVCTEEDFKVIDGLHFNIEIMSFKGMDPIFLPYYTMKELQKSIRHDFIYYTEADQILYIEEQEMIFHALNENVYIVPQRLEKLYKNFGAERGDIVIFNGEKYVVCNKTNRNNLIYFKNNNFYINQDQINAFGGAFLCNKDLLKRVVFTASTILPIEQISGFNIFFTPGAICLKTTKILEFFVDHLSGFEYHQELSGEFI
jgi:hypothetical protein